MGRNRGRLRHAGSIAWLLAALLCGCDDAEVATRASRVDTLAGASGGAGYFDGTTADPVRFDSPAGVAVIGTDRYVADEKNHVIRKVAADNTVTTFAGAFGIPGSLDGRGAAARFRSPGGIAAVGSILFVADTGNHTIRRIITEGTTRGEVATVAGIPERSGSENNTDATLATFKGPRGLVGTGNVLYVADTENHVIRRVVVGGGVSPVAGLAGISGTADGFGEEARFSSPQGIALIGNNTLYVADTGNHTVRKIILTSSFGDVTLLAGLPGVPGESDGTGTGAGFRSPEGIATDGTDLFVADTGNHTVRVVSQAGTVATLAGAAGLPGATDGAGNLARFQGPRGIGLLAGSSVFHVADGGNHAIRLLTRAGEVSTAAGNPPRPGAANGVGTAARFRDPAGLAVAGDNVFVADAGNHSIRIVSPSGSVSLFAGSGDPDHPGTADGTGSAARFTEPSGVAAVGSDRFVADTGNHAIRKVSASGAVTLFAGLPGSAGNVDGTGSAARFNRPTGIFPVGTDLYVTDAGSHTIRKVTASAQVTTVAGEAGVEGSENTPEAPKGRFKSPEGIFHLPTGIGTVLYVADTGNHTIRKVTINGTSVTVETYAGTAGSAGYVDAQGIEARFSSPAGIAGDSSILFVADRGNHAIRRISGTRSVTTFSGSGEAATTRDGTGIDALFNAPGGIAGVPGVLYLSDGKENVLRKVTY